MLVSNESVEKTSQSLEPLLHSKIEIKELENTPLGIRLKYERYHQGRKEEGFYPKKGEVSNNFSNRISDDLLLIAQGLLTVFGLDRDVWDNSSLFITKICFFYPEANNGLDTLEITVKLEVKNHLLGKKQSFSIPRITEDILLENNLKSTVIHLLSELQDFYFGKVKLEQTSLF